VPRFKTYKKYSGPVFVGSRKIAVPSLARTLERQHWLTAQVETNGTYGTVVMFDGTVITAGPDQFILVYPRELANEDFNARDDQGPLTRLLRRLEPTAGLAKDIESLWSLFEAENWYVAQDGFIRYLEADKVRVGGRNVQVRQGDIVHGAVLRNTITPVQGTVPRKGPEWAKACSFGEAVHRLFSNPAGVSIQDAYGQEKLAKRYARMCVPGSSGGLDQYLFNQSVTSATVFDIGQEMDLAMAVWYSNSVNAPAIAMKRLKECLARCKDNQKTFPAALLRALGTTRYGRWNASEKNGRYQRTRRHAMRSGLWDRSLFVGRGAIMPASL
jgi:hypothetical protein